MTKRFVQIALMGVLVLGVASLAIAQQVPEPMVRLGNFIEVGNDVFMHIMASADIRYRTTTNYDFDSKVRDRVNSRFPGDTVVQDGAGDETWAELRLGVEAKYQKNLTLYLLFEHQQIFDGNTIDDRSNSTTPGGTDVFGRAPATENPGFHIERYWIDYKFAGTPFRMRVGADLWNQDQAGLVGDDDPRFAVFGDFGDFDVMAAAVVQYEAQRLGLTNDNDFIYYTFSGGYNLKPHRFQLDVTYFRDRFLGADTQSPVPSARGVAGASALGFQGQKTDSVLIMGSWSGRFGPVRGLVQGNILTGTAHGGTNVAGLPAGAIPNRKYDIFAGAVVAYAEVDLGIVRPFVGFVYASGDGDPTDNKLHGFNNMPENDIGNISSTSFFEHLDFSTAFQKRDYGCPGQLQGVRTQNTLGGSGIAGNPNAIGAAVLGAGSAFQCSHSTGNVFNDRIGNTSHLGIATPYSNPGTFDIPIGVRSFPLKGHEITGWFVHRRVEKSALIDRAFIVGTDPGFNGHIRKALYNEFGGFWMWTLNPYFDIRLAGTIAIPDGGYRDIGRLSNCLPGQAATGGPRQGCSGSDPALQGEARFRARF